MHACTRLTLAHGKRCAETLAPIFAHGKEVSRLVNAIGIFGIDRQPCKVERSPAYIERTVDLGPTVARIVGAEQRRMILGFHDGVNTRSLAGRDADANSPQIALGQSIAQFMPGSSAIGTLE